MAVTTDNTNKPILPRGADVRPIDSYNRASLYSGKALDFDGVNDYVDLDGFTMTGNVATIVFQAKFSNDQYLLDIDTQRFVIRNTVADGFGVFNSTAWISYGDTLRDEVGFYAVVSNGTTQRAYFNGHQLGSDETIAALDWDSVTKVKIASNNTGTNNFFDGQIAGFKIFNTALTAAQVADLYNNPEKAVPTGVDNTALKLWLPMMEGAGTTVYDGSGNGNHGTISGATYVNGVGSPVAQSAVIDWNKQSYLGGVVSDDYYINNNFANFQTQTEVTFYAEFVCQGETAFDEEQQLIDWGYNNGFRLRLDSSNQPQLINSGGSNILTSTTAINFNEFNRIAGKGDASGLKIFLNGTQIASNSTALILPGTSQTTIAVGANASTSENFKGVIPEAKVWTTALTDAQLESLTAGTTNPEDYTSGALAHWTGASEYQDQVGNYDLTANGSPVRFLAPQGLTSGRDIFNALFENVRKQGALNLDGQSWAEVHDNASLDVTTGLTLEAWVKPTDTGANKMIISKWSPFAVGQRSYLFYQSLSEILYFSISTDGVSSNTIVGPSAHKDDWFHFVGTYDGATQKLYVNGSEVATQAQTGSIYSGSFQLEIGRHHGDNSAINPSPIAQPRIYNRALTASEVLNNYNTTKNQFE